MNLVAWLGTKVGAAVAAAVTGFIPFRSVPIRSVCCSFQVAPLLTAVYGRVENTTQDLLAYYTNCDLLAAGAVDSGTVGTIHQAM